MSTITREIPYSDAPIDAADRWWERSVKPHLARLQREYGTPDRPIGAYDIPADERAIAHFWAKVDKSGPCWLWQGQITRLGYPRFVFFINGQRYTVAAHRLSYQLAHGHLPAGKDIDHVRDAGCQHRHCVNPAHLEAVTHRENVLRGDAPTAVNARKTHCVHGHEFTPANTRIDSTGSRHCRTCQVAAEERRRARKGNGHLVPTPNHSNADPGLCSHRVAGSSEHNAATGGHAAYPSAAPVAAPPTTGADEATREGVSARDAAGAGGTGGNTRHHTDAPVERGDRDSVGHRPALDSPEGEIRTNVAGRMGPMGRSGGPDDRGADRGAVGAGRRAVAAHAAPGATGRTDQSDEGAAARQAAAAPESEQRHPVATGVPLS